jgi:tRNA dimethylallyltransferase
MKEKTKVIAIVGPTSSGKTSLSIAVAKKFNGEVISADSRQVYIGMDIATGKVTKEEMENIPHHLLDIADPKEVYTAADFKKDATVAILDIQKRGRLPIIAGGSTFYIELLRGNLQSAPVPPDELFRASLESLSTEELFEKLKKLDKNRADKIDSKNRRRLERALEIVNVLGKVPETKKGESLYDWLLIGIDLSKEQLHHNIHVRLLDRINSGMIEEAKELHNEGVSYERMDNLGLEYRYLAKYLQKEISMETMVQQIEIKNKQYAKRQMTWLKRDKTIEWFVPENREAIFRHVENFLHATDS